MDISNCSDRPPVRVWTGNSDRTTATFTQSLVGGMEAIDHEAETLLRRKRTTTKSVLRLPDLEHAKAAVLNSLTSLDAQRGYRHAIDEFVDWYCSEPRLALNRIVVLRYRSHLESRQLAPGTVNLRLGAVRRLAYEAADCGLLSADSAAGIRRVKGVKKLGVTPRQLADRGAGPRSLASTRSSTTERKTRPSITSIAARVRLETA